MPIYSIFGQMDELAAREMIKRGKATEIPTEDIPASERTHKDGRTARLAIVIQRKHVAELEELTKDFYA